LGLFPEGTSTGGDQVLPFHSSLLAPAEEHQWPVTPAWISYSIEDGSVADEICYWREMTFFPHFLNLLSKKRIQARVIYGKPLLPGLNRKEMARRLHEQVCQLKETHTSVGVLIYR
jgi:1-acyl-sn-glycerol-3-phosphate acyltransferase